MREPEYCANHGLGAYYCAECVDEVGRRADAAELRVAELDRLLDIYDDEDATIDDLLHDLDLLSKARKASRPTDSVSTERDG